ncbi:YlqD family protein [Mesobacillus foraminis]|uniref:YlqD protein n=1 Tax=Mesobacillus foraminis TaxID=279826 RepID=A0A4R2BI83_9BACI|nr:YlqD family protein [Mesobacillus foraminis]TCN25644.1 YlqD protein [Mesobacillus foraminis]
MKVLQTVVVKQVLTETSKQGLLKKYQERKFQLQKECHQLIFELKKQEKSKKFPSESLKKHFGNEMNSYKEKIKLLDFQIEQLHILPLGSELKETELQSIVDLNEGDAWDGFLSGKAVIIKDGIVVEIRER